MQSRIVLVLAGVAGGIVGCGSPGAGGDLPVYRCVRVADMPVIDGRLDDAAWEAAERVELVRADTGAEPRQATTVRGVWTDTHLCVGFVCVDNDIWAGITEHDGDIYEQEVVEVFIDANLDGKSYIELEINPLNVVLDMYILNPGPGERFHGMRDLEMAGLQTAVEVTGDVAVDANEGPGDDQVWTVEIAMPFSQFPLAPNRPPRPGDRWRWNLYRIDRPGGDTSSEYTAFSPPGEINYHMPMKFGWLEFRE